MRLGWRWGLTWELGNLKDCVCHEGNKQALTQLTYIFLKLQTMLFFCFWFLRFLILVEECYLVCNRPWVAVQCLALQTNKQTANPTAVKHNWIFCRVIFKSEWVTLVGGSLLTQILPHMLLLESWVCLLHIIRARSNDSHLYCQDQEGWVGRVIHI